MRTSPMYCRTRYVLTWDTRPTSSRPVVWLILHEYNRLFIFIFYAGFRHLSPSDVPLLKETSLNISPRVRK